MAMRYVSMKERQKRGCLECYDRRMRSKGISCPYDRCPYRELDKYDNYEDFIQEKECIIGLLLRDTDLRSNSREKEKKSRCRKVMAVETGEVFNSVVEAARACGTSKGAIHQALRQPTWKCCGYHWKKCDD